MTMWWGSVGYQTNTAPTHTHAHARTHTRTHTHTHTHAPTHIGRMASCHERSTPRLTSSDPSWRLVSAPRHRRTTTDIRSWTDSDGPVPASHLVSAGPSLVEDGLIFLSRSRCVFERCVCRVRGTLKHRGHVLLLSLSLSLLLCRFWLRHITDVISLVARASKGVVGRRRYRSMILFSFVRK